MSSGSRTTRAGWQSRPSRTCSARVWSRSTSPPPRGQGHRPRVLADAGGDEEACPRPPPCPDRDRRRSQAAAPERGRPAAEERQAARRGPRLEAGHVLAEEDMVAKSPAEGGLPPFALDDLVGRSAPSAAIAARSRRAATADVGSPAAPSRDARDGAVSDPLFDLSGRVAVVTGGWGSSAQSCPWRWPRAGCGWRSSTSRPKPAPGAPGSRPASTRDDPRSRVRRHRPGAGRGGAALVEVDWGVPHLLVNAAAIDAPPDAPAEEVGPFEDVPSSRSSGSSTRTCSASSFRAR